MWSNIFSCLFKYFIGFLSRSFTTFTYIIHCFCMCMSTGMTYGQVNLSCEQFCLSKKTVCTCMVTQTSLRWELVNGSVDLGDHTLFGDDLNQPSGLFSPYSFITNSFEVNVTKYMSESITATMSFITLSEYQGYDIICEGSSTIPIVIPGNS